MESDIPSSSQTKPTASARDKIRDSLAAFANQHIAAFDTYGNEYTSSDLGFDFVSRQTDYEGCTLTVSKATVPGLTLDQHHNFRENLMTMVPMLDDRITLIECPPVDGLRCII